MKTIYTKRISVTAFASCVNHFYHLQIQLVNCNVFDCVCLSVCACVSQVRIRVTGAKLHTCSWVACFLSWVVYWFQGSVK